MISSSNDRGGHSPLSHLYIASQNSLHSFFHDDNHHLTKPFYSLFLDVLLHSEAQRLLPMNVLLYEMFLFLCAQVMLLPTLLNEMHRNLHLSRNLVFSRVQVDQTIQYDSYPLKVPLFR